MSHIFNVLLLLVCAGAILILLKRIRGGWKKTSRISLENQRAQEIYNKKMHNKKDEVQSLTLEDRIELSWAFLLNITEQVMNRFSSNDQKKVEEAGHILSKNGARYQHNVIQEVRTVQSIIQSRSKSQDVEQSRSM